MILSNVEVIERTSMRVAVREHPNWVAGWSLGWFGDYLQLTLVFGKRHNLAS